MMKTIISIICGIGFMVSSAVAFETPEEKKARILSKYDQTNEYEKCINVRDIKKTVILDDQNLLFELRRNKYVLNTLQSECDGMFTNQRFNYNFGYSKICKQYPVVARGGACMFNDFQVLTKRSES